MSEPIIKTGEMEQVWQTINVLSEALGKQSAALVKLSEVVTAQNTRITELERTTGE